ARGLADLQLEVVRFLEVLALGRGLAELAQGGQRIRRPPGFALGIGLPVEAGVRAPAAHAGHGLEGLYRAVPALLIEGLRPAFVALVLAIGTLLPPVALGVLTIALRLLTSMLTIALRLVAIPLRLRLVRALQEGLRPRRRRGQ